MDVNILNTVVRGWRCSPFSFMVVQWKSLRKDASYALDQGSILRIRSQENNLFWILYFRRGWLTFDRIEKKISWCVRKLTRHRWPSGKKKERKKGKSLGGNFLISSSPKQSTSPIADLQFPLFLRVLQFFIIHTQAPTNVFHTRILLPKPIDTNPIQHKNLDDEIQQQTHPLIDRSPLFPSPSISRVSQLSKTLIDLPNLNPIPRN